VQKNTAVLAGMPGQHQSSAEW